MSYDYNEAINKFVKMTLCCDLRKISDYRICIRREDGYVDITAILAEDADDAKADMILEFPKYNGRKRDFGIDLAGLLGTKLRNLGQSAGGKKSSNNMTAEQRKARAKKAVEARKAKYGR